MNKRPKEIDELMKLMESFFLITWKPIKDYIEQLEKFQQETLTAEERKWDDGK